LDEFGEEDCNLRRGKPLFLNEHRFKALQAVHVQHRVAQEVSAVRSSSDRVIRENFY
jgi:Proteolysis_6 C-terminal